MHRPNGVRQSCLGLGWTDAAPQVEMPPGDCFLWQSSASGTCQFPIRFSCPTFRLASETSVMQNSQPPAPRPINDLATRLAFWFLLCSCAGRLPPNKKKMFSQGLRNHFCFVAAPAVEKHVPSSMLVNRSPPPAHPSPDGTAFRPEPRHHPTRHNLGRRVSLQVNASKPP
jgi:hypothetical protein